MGYETCSVAYPDGCHILQTESTDPAMCAMEAKVHRAEYGELRADVHPSHGDGELASATCWQGGRRTASGTLHIHDEGLPLWNTQVV